MDELEATKHWLPNYFIREHLTSEVIYMFQDCVKSKHQNLVSR